MRKALLGSTILVCLSVTRDVLDADGKPHKFPAEEDYDVDVSVEEPALGADGKPQLDADGKPKVKTITRKEKRTRAHPRGGLFSGHQEHDRYIERAAIVTAVHNDDGTSVNATVFPDVANDARLNFAYLPRDPKSGELYVTSCRYDAEASGNGITFRGIDEGGYGAKIAGNEPKALKADDDKKPKKPTPPTA